MHAFFAYYAEGPAAVRFVRDLFDRSARGKLRSVLALWGARVGNGLGIDYPSGATREQTE